MEFDSTPDLVIEPNASRTGVGNSPQEKVGHNKNRSSISTVWSSSQALSLFNAGPKTRSNPVSSSR